MNAWKDKKFLTYFGLLYVANLAAISASNSIFLSSISLGLLGANKTFIAFIIALPRYMVIILSVITYKLADRINKRKLVAWGSVVGVIAFTGLSFSKSYVSLIIFGMLYGAAYMVALTYITAMLLDYTPVHQRIGVLGIFTTSSSLGSFFGPYLTNFILQKVLTEAGANAVFPKLSLFGMFFLGSNEPNPNLMFLSGVIYYVVVGIFLSLAQKFATHMEKVIIQTKPTNHNAMDNSLFKGYSGLIMLDILMGAMWMSLMTFIPGYDHFVGLNASIWFFSGFSIVGLFGRLILAPQLGSWKPSLIVKGAFSIYIGCFAAMILFDSFPNQWLLLFVGSMQGLAHGVMYPTMNILFTQKTPYVTAKATLVFVVLFQTGTMFDIPLGAIVDYFGYKAMFICAFITSLVVFVYCLSRPVLKIFLKELDANILVKK